jgi:acyl carrier protein
MDETSIRGPIRAYIVDNFLLGSAGELEDSTQLMEAGILDSTGVIELVAFLETTFGVTIADEEIISKNLNSLNYISSFIARKSS